MSAFPTGNESIDYNFDITRHVISKLYKQGMAGLKKVTCYAVFSFCLVACILLTGCGHTGQEEAAEMAIGAQEEIAGVEVQLAETEASTATESSESEELVVRENTQSLQQNAFPELSTEQIDAYQQMTLYIQEGFRTYGIEGTYQAYFGEIGGEDGKYRCEILLEGEDELWSESIAYSYDAESRWYSFDGQQEGIFTKDSFWVLREKDSFVKDMRENYVYQAQIARNQDIAVPIRYDSRKGPVERDERIMVPDSEWMGRYVWSYLYTYFDDRMDIYITIEYPQVSLSKEALEEQINEALWEAFFYTYGLEEQEWNPGGEAYGTINRNYVITREDEEYFSVRIFEDNYFRGANHPNEWETGVTINMQTGEVLRLQDVTGTEQTPVSLLDSGAFKCLGAWESGDKDESSEIWIQQLRENWESYDRYASLDALDSYFYLTPDSLGLLTSVSRYYMPMEAKFADLGLEKYIAAP